MTKQATITTKQGSHRPLITVYDGLVLPGRYQRRIIGRMQKIKDNETIVGLFTTVEKKYISNEAFLMKSQSFDESTLNYAFSTTHLTCMTHRFA
jgi:hypothetical protein